MNAGRMSEESVRVLRHIEVNGPRTRAEIAKGLSLSTSEANTRLENLATLGHLAKDTTTSPLCFHLTNRGRQKLAAPYLPTPPRSMPKKDLTADGKSLSAKRAALVRQQQARINGDAAYLPLRRERNSAHYQPTEYHPSARPGANDALALPSRFGDRLHWRDGRITDLDGNQLS